jgi:4-amino-4-deoxy-L-arabinose transferase-like glycosyltransferase
MSRSAWVSTAFVGAVLIVVAARLAGLTVSRAEFYVDEAQYWLWAQTPAWGYFSKPPLIAWITAGAARLCGDGEACLRAPSTLAWGATALMVFAIGRTLYDLRTGVFAGLSALLAPGAVFSSRILSTDAPLLTLWSTALLALVRLRAGGGWGWAVLLGLTTGLGILAKYAMLYALAGAALAMLIDRPTRAALLSWKGAAAGVIAAVVTAPNVVWNIGNGLATARHTVGNAANDGLTPGLVEPLAFLATQFVLVGPVVFAGWLLAVVTVARPAAWARSQPADRVLLAFSLPILLVVLVLAGFSEANANWAATALIAVFLLGAATLSGNVSGRRWLVGGLALGLMVQAALIGMDARADSLMIAGRAPYARTQGARALAGAIADRAETEGALTVVAETRSQAALLIYYARNRAVMVKAWPPATTGDPQDHFQMTRPLTGHEAGPVLAVAPCAGAGRFKGWGRVTDLGTVAVPAAGGERTARLFRLETPSMPPVRPVPCMERD